MSRSVFLIGYRSSGKSSVGRILARELFAAFVDTDRIVEERSGQTIADLFREKGESAFRSLETAALEEVCARVSRGERLVVATGGGIVLSAHNTALLREHGDVIWLRALPATLRGRIEADPATSATRPSLSGTAAPGAEVEAILKAREPLYRAAATQDVDTEGSTPDAVARMILAVLGAGR